MELLRESSEQGFVPSMRFLSNIYRDCMDEASIMEAVRWMEMAADAGDPDGMYDTGVLYESLGDDESMRKAFGWFCKAAESGMPEAMHELSEMYHTGKGTEPDSQKSAKWLEKARKTEPYRL